jgi:hypothetical protein
MYMHTDLDCGFAHDVQDGIQAGHEHDAREDDCPIKPSRITGKSLVYVSKKAWEKLEHVGAYTHLTMPQVFLMCVSEIHTYKHV